MFVGKRVLKCQVFSQRLFCEVKPPVIKGNYYEILGVSRDAEKDAIIQKYKDLARKYHPDICKGSEDYFANLTNAYQTLIDDEKRTQYDNEHLYTDEYFKTQVAGGKFDIRKLFWGGIALFAAYQGYRYYDNNYSQKCPLTEEERKNSMRMERQEVNQETVPTQQKQ